jgi:hypothetical protein
MIIEVTRIGDDSSIRRAVVDTARRDDAARWERLAQQAALKVPPPYRPEPARPAYQISAGGHAARVAEKGPGGAAARAGQRRAVRTQPRLTKGLPENNS